VNFSGHLNNEWLVEHLHRCATLEKHCRGVLPARMSASMRTMLV
jgi:hypothetical protein